MKYITTLAAMKRSCYIFEQQSRRRVIQVSDCIRMQGDKLPVNIIRQPSDKLGTRRKITKLLIINDGTLHHCTVNLNSLLNLWFGTCRRTWCERCFQLFHV